MSRLICKIKSHCILILFTTSVVASGCDLFNVESYKEIDPGIVKWQVELSGSITYSTPAIGPDSTIYIASDSDSLTAIHPDGSVYWSYHILNQPHPATSPAISNDGTIYFASSYLFAFDPDGTLKWRYHLGEAASSPAIGFDGTIYITKRAISQTDDSQIMAINPDGTLKWSNHVDPGSSPIIRNDGYVFVGTINNGLLRYDYDGVPRGLIPTSACAGSPAVGNNNRMFFIAADSLIAVSSTGLRMWSFSFPANVDTIVTPVLGIDETIYVGTYAGNSGGYLYAINPDGSLKWRVDTIGAIVSTPAVGNDGTIYVGCKSGFVYAVNPEGELLWRHHTDSWIGSSPAIGYNGTLYIGSSSNVLYAFETGSTGLVESSWPKYRGDYRNSGRR